MVFLSPPPRMSPTAFPAAPPSASPAPRASACRPSSRTTSGSIETLGAAIVPAARKGSASGRRSVGEIPPGVSEALDEGRAEHDAALVGQRLVEAERAIGRGRHVAPGEREVRRARRVRPRGEARYRASRTSCLRGSRALESPPPCRRRRASERPPASTVTVRRLASESATRPSPRPVLTIASQPRPRLVSAILPASVPEITPCAVVVDSTRGWTWTPSASKAIRDSEPGRVKSLSTRPVSVPP